MKKLILIFIFLPFLLFSQNTNHWETVVFEDDYWKYLEGNFEPDTNWRELTFDDSSWLQGIGGLGYGDGGREGLDRANKRRRPSHTFYDICSRTPNQTRRPGRPRHNIG